MRFRQIIEVVFPFVQGISVIYLLIAGLILILSGGIFPTIETLSRPTVTTGFTLFGLGVAIASFILSQKSQKEILEALKALK